MTASLILVLTSWALSVGAATPAPIAVLADGPAAARATALAEAAGGVAVSVDELDTLAPGALLVLLDAQRFPAPALEQVIAHLNKGAKLEMGIRIGVGRGYVSADRNKRAEDPIGVITVDSLFSPVVRCTYVVEDTRVGQRTDYDKLTLEVETNGSLDPADAVAQAGHIINEHMLVFSEQAVSGIPDEDIFGPLAEETDSVLDTPIEDLDLSVRSYNCLKRQGVNSIGQLTECTEADLLNIRNFGAKSIEEVKDKLQQMGLNLKQ